MERFVSLASCLAAVVAIACGGGTQAPAAPGGGPTSTAIDASAIIAQCPTAAEVAAIDRDLTLTFENDPTTGRVECPASQSSRDLTLLQAQAYRVLNVARRLTFDAPLPWTTSALYPWIVSSIRGIRFRGDIGTSFCCDPAGTIDIQAQNLSALQFPTDFRWVGTLLVLVVHETRHNNGFPHTCGTNDNTIAELGAWGVQYHTDVFLGSHSDPAFITPAQRAGFLQDAQGICSSRFCRDKCP
jgi:hypothetical protein